jgi:magnesium transporter
MTQVRKKDYPVESVGSLMSTHFVAVPDYYTVGEAIQLLRRQAMDTQSKYYVYVVDDRLHLKGVVPLRYLLSAADERKLVEIMTQKVISISAEADREEVARLMREYDIVAVPVVDGGGALVGVINADDVLDIVEEETREDFHKMASVGLMTTGLREASVRLLFQKRVSWLLVLVFVNIFSGAAIAAFEETIEAVVALVFFLPLLIDSGGNAGSQAATLVVRALATGDVKLRDWSRLLGKEIVVAGLLGLTMGLAVLLLGFYRAGPEVAAVVALTMLLVVVVGSLIGISLPLILSRFRLDPATASAPLVTSVADVCGVVIYFSIATWYLGLW